MSYLLKSSAVTIAPQGHTQSRSDRNPWFIAVVDRTGVKRRGGGEAAEHETRPSWLITRDGEFETGREERA